MGEDFSGPGSSDTDLSRARDGDGAAFARLVEPWRRELHAHCYRVLGSAHDAEDALQDALLRAWRGIGGFAGRSSLRTWLYTVTTHACLDIAEARGKRALPVDIGPSSERAAINALPLNEIAWLGPYPDAGLAGSGPGARYEQREAVELAFAAAMQHLPGNQRAALLLFDVVGFTVAEIADMMQTSATSVNSALARARRVVAQKVASPSQQQALRKVGDAQLRQTVARFSAAFEHRDVDALVALLTEDVTWSMPPLAQWYQGIEAVMNFAVAVPLTLCPSFRTRVTSANGQPALGFYVGESPNATHTAWSITVLTLRGGQICDMTSFIDPEAFTLFGLPAVLDEPASDADSIGSLGQE